VPSASSKPAVTARHHEGYVAGKAGARLFRQAWVPEDDARAVVVVAHGAAEHGGRYRYVVERLVPEGVAVYAIDHRGHGRSSGRRAQIDRMAHVVADLDAFVRHARDEHAGRPVFVLGHSMGGTVALAYALAHQDTLTGLVLSSPLARVEAAPLPLRLIARALSVVAPDVGLYQVEGGAVSRDPAEVEAYETDSLVYRGKLPARTLQELATTIGTLPDALARLTVPLLVQIGTADGLVPPEGGRLVHARAGSADKTLREYEGFAHELYNEPAGDRERALDDLARWLLERSPATG
jgi:alpha-beta hydrolase superfamily lysophospholipase